MSPATTSEAKLREAMHRLLSGTARLTDGRLLKENLYKEAGVSRATMNRYTSILAEWDAQVTTSQPRNPQVEALESTISDLRRTVRELRSENRRLREQLTIAATTAAELAAEAEAFREGREVASVVPLRPTRS